jgi:hypothetical protein
MVSKFSSPDLMYSMSLSTISKSYSGKSAKEIDGVALSNSSNLSSFITMFYSSETEVYLVKFKKLLDFVLK